MLGRGEGGLLRGEGSGEGNEGDRGEGGWEGVGHFINLVQSNSTWSTRCSGYSNKQRDYEIVFVESNYEIMHAWIYFM